VIEIHAAALLAVQGHPVPAVKATLPLPPVGVNEPPEDPMEKLHGKV
jgi:hypothetical protein